MPTITVTQEHIDLAAQLARDRTIATGGTSCMCPVGIAFIDQEQRPVAVGAALMFDRSRYGRMLTPSPALHDFIVAFDKWWDKVRSSANLSAPQCKPGTYTYEVRPS